MDDLARSVQIYAATHFAVMGLSHVIRAPAWVELFVLLRSQGRPGVFAHGFLSLFFGATIVSLHNVWTSPEVALTVVGWLYVAKAASCFLTPGIQLASLNRVSNEREWEMRAAGMAYLLLALWLALQIAGRLAS